MLGNYEDGNNLQYNQYEGEPRDRPPPSSHGRSGHPVHKDKMDPSFQGSTSYGSTKQDHSSGHSSSQPSKKFPILDNSIPILSKEGPVKTHKTKMDSWPDTRDYATLPPVLPDLSPPAGPLSPLHSSDSSESEQDMEEDNDANEHPISPHCKGSSERTPPSHHSETQQKEASHLGGDAPMPASQTFPLPLSSKPNLANSRKPMALVRPMDGPDQVNSKSPDLKPSPDDYHGQSYESLSDLKTSVGKPNLPPLKIPSQSEVSVILLLNCRIIRFVCDVQNICFFFQIFRELWLYCGLLFSTIGMWSMHCIQGPADLEYIFMLVSLKLSNRPSISFFLTYC